MTFTLGEAVNAAGFGGFHTRLMFLCGMVYCADAMEIMILALILPAVREEWDLPAWQEASVASFVFVGSLCGSAAWGIVADKWGRRKGYLASTCLTSVLGLASAFSPNVTVLIMTRCIVGFGVGGVHVVFSLFTEFLPTAGRGFYLVVFEMFWTAGALLTAVLAWVIMPTLGWRYLVGFLSIPMFVMVAMYPIVPESPRYLLINERFEETEELLRAVARKNKRSMPPGQLERKIVDFEDKGTLYDVLNPAYRRVTLLLWALWICNAMTYYVSVLMTAEYFDTGADGEAVSSDRYYLSICLTTLAEVPGVLAAAFVISRIGRVRGQLYFCAAAGLAFLLLLFHSVYGIALTGGILSRALIMGAFSILYVFTPEVYPTAFRATAFGTCVALSRVGGILAPVVSTVLYEIDESIPIVMSSVVCFGAAVCCIFLPFDTTGKQLSDTMRKVPGVVSAELAKRTSSMRSVSSDGAPRRPAPEPVLAPSNE